MQIILDLQDDVEESEVPGILRRLADDYTGDRESGDEGGMLRRDDMGNGAGDWLWSSERLVTDF